MRAATGAALCVLFLCSYAAVGHPGHGIVVDSQQRVFFADVSNAAVWR